MTVSVRSIVRSPSVALLAVLAACNSDSPADPQPFEGRALETLGRGAMTQRHMAEVWTRGNVAYTSTWGQRNGVVGNAVHIWRIEGADLPAGTPVRAIGASVVAASLGSGLAPSSAPIRIAASVTVRVIGPAVS